MIFNMKCSIFLVIFMITKTIGFPIDIDQQVKSHESNATGYITITKNPGPLI